MTDEQINELKQLGYTVEVALERQYRVAGTGVSVVVSSDDDAASQSLIDGHAERLLQQSETEAETLARHQAEVDSDAQSLLEASEPPQSDTA